MSLLDKLLEKKDVELYLKLRAGFLKKIKHREVMKNPEDRREMIRQRFDGRIEELHTMLNVVKEGKIKDKSKSYFHKINKIAANDPDIIEQIERGKKSGVGIRDFEDVMKEIDDIEDGKVVPIKTEDFKQQLKENIK